MKQNKRKLCSKKTTKEPKKDENVKMTFISLFNIHNNIDETAKV